MTLRSFFLLAPDVAFLNHGSFGATPQPVLDAQQAWQERLERQPVAFLGRELMGYLAALRDQLGAYVHASPRDLVFIPNVTYGLNLVARSLALGPGDTVLTTNHEYGACNLIWEYISGKTGAAIVHQEIDLPVPDAADFVSRFWQGVSPSTRVIFLSHITSPTAQIFPLREICRRARETGILTIIDGAHGPGQIPLDLTAIEPDFYLGNCHKWMMGPKGSGFLFTRRDKQHLIEPLIVSWGWGEDFPYTTGSKYLDMLQWPGTHNPAPFLAVPAALAFQDEHDWSSIRARCHDLLMDGLAQLNELTRMPEMYSRESEGFSQMGIARLPEIRDPVGMQASLVQQYKVEVPIYRWSDGYFIRVSVQGYNVIADLQKLVHALEALLPEWVCG